MSNSATRRFALEALEPRILLSADGLSGSTVSCQEQNPSVASYEVSQADQQTEQASHSFDGSMAYDPAASLQDVFGGVTDSAPAPAEVESPADPAPAAAERLPSLPPPEMAGQGASSAEVVGVAPLADLVNPTAQQLTDTLHAANGPPAAGSGSVQAEARPTQFTLRLNGDAIELVDGDSKRIASRAKEWAGSFVIQGVEGEDNFFIVDWEIAALSKLQVQIQGGSAADSLRILSSAGSSRQWIIDGQNSGTVGNIQFRGIENLTGGEDDFDTFTLEAGGGLDGLLHGGDRGFDVLAISGTQIQSALFTASGPDSGTIDLDGKEIRYAGLEPITLSGAANLVVDASSGDDALVIDLDGVNIRVRSTTATIESVSFGAPTGSLTVNGAGGKDSVTVTANLNLPGANLTINAESITVNPGVTISTQNGVLYGDITFAASAVKSSAIFLVPIVEPIAQIQITDAIINGGTINFTSSALATANFLGVEIISELTPAVAIAKPNALVSVGGNSNISSHTDANSSGNLTLAAIADVSVNIQARSRSTGSTNVDVAAAVAIVNSSAVARVLGNTVIDADGVFTLSSASEVDATALADGTAGGTTAVGAGIAFTWVDEVSEAYIDESVSVTDAAAVIIKAASDNNVSATANATPNGASATGIDGNILLGNLIMTLNAPPFNLGIPPFTIPSLPTGDFEVAAALAFNRIDSHTRASLVSDDTIDAGSSLTISSANNTDTTSTANATNIDGSLIGVGVGAAAAINVSDALNEAFLGGSPDISAGAVTVEAVINHDLMDNDPDGVDRSAAVATSGAGATDVGVAGALALNFVNHVSNALIRSGATIDLHGVDLLLSAANESVSTASASPELAGGDFGVGGAVAVNIAGPDARAAIENTASLTGVRDLTLLASGDHAMLTIADGGATSVGTAIGAGIALAIPTGETRAEIGTGVAMSLSGLLTLDASHTTATTTTADGQAGGPAVGLGASFGLTVTDETASATVGRNVTTSGDATLVSVVNGTVTTTAQASRQGTAGDSTPAGDLIDDWIGFAVTNGWVAPAFTVIGALDRKSVV